MNQFSARFFFFFNELWHLVTLMGNQDGFDLLAGSSGPAQYQKCFLSGCWSSSFWTPQRGKSLAIPLSCFTPSLRLALSKSMNNVCLYSFHALPPAHGGRAELECKCTWACQTVYKNRYEFWRQPLSHPQKNGTESRVLQSFIELGFFNHFQWTIMPSLFFFFPPFQHYSTSLLPQGELLA